jgi:hypothetical protein
LNELHKQTIPLKKSEEMMQHGRNATSDARKRHIVTELQSRLGVLEHKLPNRPDWYMSVGDKIEVFITDSKFHENHRWFDMAYKDVRVLAEHPAAFIIFVLGRKDNFLVIPAKEMSAELVAYQPGHPIQDGRYHLNLPLGGNAFAQLPQWKLNQYADNLDLIGRIPN